MDCNSWCAKLIEPTCGMQPVPPNGIRYLGFVFNQSGIVNNIDSIVDNGTSHTYLLSLPSDQINKLEMHIKWFLFYSGYEPPSPSAKYA